MMFNRAIELGSTNSIIQLANMYAENKQYRLTIPLYLKTKTVESLTRLKYIYQNHKEYFTELEIYDLLNNFSQKIIKCYICYIRNYVALYNCHCLEHIVICIKCFLFINKYVQCRKMI